MLARDWRYSIESITYHREALVICKKADAPRLDEAQIGGRAAAARRAGAGSRAAWVGGRGTGGGARPRGEAGEGSHFPRT